MRAIGDHQGEGKVLCNIGNRYASVGEKQKALESYNRALPIIRQTGDRLAEAQVLSDLASLYDSLGKPQQALELYQKAITISEAVRGGATIEEIKSGLSGQTSPPYVQAALLMMHAGRHAEAFDLTERARARTFLDQIGNIRPRQLGTTVGQMAQEEQSRASELASLQMELLRERAKPRGALDTTSISKRASDLASKEAEYEDLLVRLKATNPEYASLRSVDTLKLAEVQKLLSKDTTLLSYFVTPEKTIAFVVTSDSLTTAEIAVREADLQSAVAWFRAFASLRREPPQALKQLYRLLISPVKSYIKTPKLSVIPHGVLHYVPFAALTDGEHCLGDEHAVFYLPSASVMPFIRRKSKPIGTEMLALAQSRAEGLPALRYADQEAQAVAALFSKEALTTGTGSKSEFLKRAPSSSIVHIAAHAELNTASPLFSRIMLAEAKDVSGGLELREVYDLDLSKTSLVVLSACETQLGALSKGDDIVGLTRAFIYAGTPSVIASLWTVDDESTSYLMKAFYSHLKDGMSKAEALQAAQSETRKLYPHPYYWAGFVLTGDPGQRAKR
jgi:CHAT domain-containing protein